MTGEAFTLERMGENGYARYRIPGVVITDKGTILAYYEARQGGDWSVIDLYCRRSVDGGESWEPRRLLYSGRGRNTTNNPVMIADGERVHLLFLENYKRLFYAVSRDEGVTFSEPREITDALEEGRGAWPWTCAAVGPGHGLRMENGRLLASVWLANDPANIISHGNTRVSTLYSDDGGETWHLGEVFAPEGTVSPNEACLAQLSDGRVMMNIRTVRTGDGPHFRTLAFSEDGVCGWGGWRRETQLRDPACFGGMCGSPHGILFTNCDSYVSRARHTLYKSVDDGDTWERVAMYEPLAGYSDCAYCAARDSAYMVYEYETESEIRVLRFGL